MQFTCSTKELYEALDAVSRAASGKGALAILDGILMRAEANQLFLTGYNLELGITAQIDAQVQASGAIVLPAKTITGMVHRMPQQEICFKGGPKGIMSITSGAAAYSIPGMKAEEYPQLPEMKNTEQLTLLADRFCSMIGQTQFAVAQSSNRPIQTGALLEADAKQLVMASTDGYRLAVRRENTGGSSLETRIVIPGKALVEIARLSKGHKTVALQWGGRFISAKLGKYRLFSRLLEGEFFDYVKAIPTEPSTTALAPRKALIESVTRASLMITDRLKSPLRMKFSDNLIRLSCETSLGRSYDEVPCSVTGSELEVGFNAQYLLDALKAADEDQVKLELKSPLAPMKVVSSDNDRYLFLVLPVRLKSA